MSSKKLIITLLTFSIITPFISFFIVKNNRFIYHTYRPNLDSKYFVQVFYQTSPSKELNYIACSLQPIKTAFDITVDLIPRITNYEYYLLPRGIFYRSPSVKEPKNSIFKHNNILSKAWRKARDRNLKFFFIVEGECIPIAVDKTLTSQWQEEENFVQTKLWQQLKLFINNYAKNKQL